MQNQLEGKVALVTGAARGIGRGIALVLAQRGADIAAADLNLDGANEVASEITQLGRKARAYQVDVTNASSVQVMVEEAISHFGQIDILANAAGVIGAPGFEDTTTSREEDWDITYAVNVKGTVLTSKAVAEHMKQRRSGKIVNISSHGGRVGSAGGGAYGASKAAVIHLTQSFALELAPYDINVNCICPGTLWTPMWERIAERSRRNNPEMADLSTREIFDMAITERCPLGRAQTPEDIGKTAAFFASDDAINITGQSLNVNGGIRMN